MAEKKTAAPKTSKPDDTKPATPEVDPAANYTGTGERDPEPK